MKKISKRIISAMVTAICAVSTIGAASVSAISINTPITESTITVETGTSVWYLNAFNNVMRVKFPNKTYWVGGDPNVTMSANPRNLPSNVFYTDDAVGNGYNQLAINCSNSGSRGFALKMVSEYYGTKSFMQVSKSAEPNGVYQPRITDVVYLSGTNHWVCIVGETEDGRYELAECNDTTFQVTWGRVMSASQLNSSMSSVLRPMMKCDVNGDSYINQKDINDLRSYVMKATMPFNVYNNFFKAAADIDGDGIVQLTDLTKLSIELSDGVINRGYLKRAN